MVIVVKQIALVKKGIKSEKPEDKETKKKDMDNPTTPGSEENQDKPGSPEDDGTLSNNKPLDPKEKAMTGEANGFLKELAQTNDFADEHRMKSYHYHKCLEPISGMMNSTKDMGQMEDVNSAGQAHPHRPL